MLDNFAVVLPVFIVVGAGYLAVWAKLFSDDHIDGMMDFAQKFAIPCLLFSAVSTLDLSQDFGWPLLLSYYTGSTICFFAGLMGARLVFGRAWPDAVAIGFACLMANTALLGLPIMERAYGREALDPNFAILSVHAAFCYFIGITAMEIASAHNKPPLKIAATVTRAMFRNSLMIGIMLGFFVNLTGLFIPGVLSDAITMISSSALPIALFGLGGVLYRYKPEGNMKEIAWICVLSLIVHPAIAFGLGYYLADITTGQLRAAVVTAAMAPGVNAFIFANMYGVAKRVAASAVLIGTALSIFSASIWLLILP